MQPLPLPVRGGSIESLAPFLNLASENDFVLVVAWLLGALRAGGPYPVLAIAGEQGSAKTVLSKLLRALIDPSVAPVRALPRDERELFIAASNGHVLAFDNLSGLPPWLSDTLCRLTSGGAFSTRRLFTDHHQLCGRLKEVGHSIAANIDTDLQKVGCASRPLRSFGHELAHMSRHRVRCSRSRRAGYCNKRFQGSGRNSLSQAVAQSAKSAMRGQPLEAHPRQHAQGHGRPHRGGAG